MKNDVAKKILDILIEHEGRDKKILFLPYKIEMWDSMESLYLECVERGITVRIHPIQYKEYISKRSYKIKFDNWFDNENVISYREYIQYNPDIIIFHYPFDGYNTITSIDTTYRSVNLKRENRTLVYIPYHGSYMTSRAASLPAVISSDYVFVSDNGVKDICESTWRAHNVNKLPKIYATGTPKSDRLVSMDENSNTVLIANSLGPFLNDVDRVSKYITLILEELNKGRKVIYRPHPLLYSAIQATQIGRLPSYEKFLSWLRYNNVEIDESKSFEDTISRCSYIYSDGGSIYDICSRAGMKVGHII